MESAINSNQIVRKCKIGKNTKIWNFVNLYGCKIGSDCKIGSFVEIQENVEVGNKVKIGSHTFICENVKIEDGVFIGHHVVFINDKYPRSTNETGELKTENDWISLRTVIKKGASVGSNATLLAGITIGKNSIVGAGAVVTKNVPKDVIVAGNPAKIIRYLNEIQK